MAEMFSPDSPWVLFRLNGQIYGIPAHNTQEMLTIPDVAPVPRAPEYVRGVINLRGSVIALIDLRVKLNQLSVKEEMGKFIATLGQRRQDHLNWVKALEESVTNGVPFTLPRDPHQCAFGKWYDNYKPEISTLSGHLLRFDSPHKAIHTAVDVVEKLMATGKKEQAIEEVKKIKETYMPVIVSLFDELETLLLNSHHEIAVVVEHSNTVLAITVDAVESVETLLPDSIEDLPGNTALDGIQKYIIPMLGRRVSTNEPVLIPDLERIIKSPFMYLQNGVVVQTQQRGTETQPTAN